jgi:3-keto-5-aminohexanoate cleavage enzyme
MSAASAPLIIEVRCNEVTMRDGNDALPYTPEEIIDDAVAAADAGASILHWHARDPRTGEPSSDLDLYQAVVDGVRAKTDLLLHPTLGYTDTRAENLEERVRHVIRTDVEPHRRIDIAPLDFGTLNADLWDPDTSSFLSGDSVYLNTIAKLTRALELFKQHGIFVYCSCWNIGQIRTARFFQESGLLGGNVFWVFAFTGDRLPGGTPPTLPALLAGIAAIPNGAPWSAYCYHGDAMQLAAWTITLGGHIALGLGDDPYIRFGAPRNADLVRRVAAMAETLGRPVATPAEAREILQLPEHEFDPVASIATSGKEQITNG